MLLNLQSEEKSIYSTWYLYDYNICNEMPQFVHSFFVAGNDRILLDNARISTSWMDDCDPNILVESTFITVPNSSMPLWSNMEEDQKAITMWYYQKFYQESNRGQILSIRKNLINSTASSATSILSNETKPSLHSSSGKISLLSSINKKLTWGLAMMGLILIKVLF